jgi:predicted O-linked N-acetylglucosamine transferase (SPINDLY family)
MNHLNQTLRRARAAFQSGEFRQGATLCRALLAEDANNLEARYFLGLSHALHGEVDTAVAEWQRVLAVRPDDFSTRANLGAALLQLERPAEAIAHLSAALAIDATHAQLHANLGRALAKTGRHAEAAQTLAGALALAPRDIDVILARAAALEHSGPQGAAIDSLNEAMRLQPEAFELHYALGVYLHRGGHPRLALARYDQALSLAPRSAPILRDKGRVLEVLQQLPDALECFRAALDQDAADPGTLAGALSCSVRLCAWDLASDYERRLRAVSTGLRALHPFLALSTAEDPADQRCCAQAHWPTSTPTRLRPEIEVKREHYGRIRIAYVSSDLGDHPVGRLLTGLIEQHDRRRFELIGVALKADAGSSEVGRRLRAAFDVYHEVSGIDDAAVANLLRQSKVDIAVDLNGYTVGGRPGIFAHRAGPVQVNYLGYAGTLGAAFMDYLLADHIVIPEGTERWYAEQVIRLPYCYLPNDDRRVLARIPSRSEVGLPEEGLVFCAFTNYYKINPPMFDVWMRLLAQLPGSVLWLRTGDPAANANLCNEARVRGVAPERLVFAPPVPDMAAHLARQRLADLYLDTLPYNAHSTTCDALWLGLPVLTCAGRSFASRVAASALTAAGLPQLITHNLEEYERRALELAYNPALLRELRAQLERSRSTSPLFDTARYTRELECAYATMHLRHLRGDPPLAFAVEPNAAA